MLFFRAKMRFFICEKIKNSHNLPYVGVHLRQNYAMKKTQPLYFKCRMERFQLAKHLSYKKSPMRTYLKSAKS